MFLVKSWITERLKNAIKHEYDVRLESHRAQLKAEQDVELERLKSSLSIAAAERNVAFSRLNERRVEVIAAIYAKLQRLYSAVEDHLWPAGYGEDPVDEGRFCN
jgi:LPS O-antigen subunit length determinant protein (WzzB/FepE family)